MIIFSEVKDERGTKRFVNMAQVQWVLELKDGVHCEIKFNSGDSIVVPATYRELREDLVYPDAVRIFLWNGK